jgi:DNA-binding transcriptional MerR regulator
MALSTGERYYTITDVAKQTELKPYTLRYWEKEFKFLRPKKNTAGRRIYNRHDIETILSIKKLLYEEGHTIDGARKKLGQLRRASDQQLTLPLEGTRGEFVLWIQKELEELKKALGG